MRDKAHFPAKAAADATKWHAKHSKDAADYGAGMPKAHCAICRHFIAPKFCGVVQGVISPAGWCQYFVAK